MDLGEGLAAVFKMESHSHPSAVEPFQGAATRVGGIVRDILSMGARPVALMRGHGAVVVGASLPLVVFRSVYTEVNARLQSQAMAIGSGQVTYLDPEEARLAEASVSGTVTRPWELWKKKALAR